MLVHNPRRTIRSLAAAALCCLLAACATSSEDASCEPYNGLDPTCLIDRPLLAEAVQSYKHHFSKITTGQKFALTQKGVYIDFTQHWLRTDKFAVIDFRKPAYEKRLYVVDWTTGAVQAYHVSHGRGSALNDRSYFASRFTNIMGSGTSSVGAYVGGQQYKSPRWGQAMRLMGLDPTNSRALERTIVFHANENFFDYQGNKFGWSCGCFMMDTTDLSPVLSILQNGGFVYAGPISLYEKSTENVVHECNPACGDEDRCATAPGANPIGSLPDVAAPEPTPDKPAYQVVPDPNPGDVPVPAQKPPGIRRG